MEKLPAVECLAELLQVGDQLIHCLIAQGCLLLQAFPNQPLLGTIKDHGGAADRRRIDGHDARDYLCPSPRFERLSSAQQLIEHRAAAEDVAPAIQFLAAQ